MMAGNASNAAGVMADRVNPPASSPERKSHLHGDWSPQINPLTVPDMPRTRPETTSLLVAKTPRANPPSKEGMTGCKAWNAEGAENAVGRTAIRLRATAFDLGNINLYIEAPEVAKPLFVEGYSDFSMLVNVTLNARITRF